MRRLIPCAAVLLWLTPLAATPGLVEEVEELVLDNGMTFLLHNRGDAPIFSGVIRWDVGSSDEPAGLTGIAHMFEHMAFKGTTAIGTGNWEEERTVLEELNRVGTELARERQRGERADSERVAELQTEYDRLVAEHRRFFNDTATTEIYSAAGAVGLNAWTSRDFTNYHLSLPANALELWCLLESARIRDAVLREFYSERDVVYEERRMRTDTSPNGALVEAFLATAFIAHPYGQPTIGWASDIENLTTDDAEAFYAAHYAPSNACAAIVGNFDKEEARDLIRRYFGPIAPGPRNVPVNTVEPEQRGERRVTIEWDSNPLLLVGYHKPDPPDHRDAIFDIIHAILTRGRSSRLHRRMVKEEQIAVSVDAFSFPGAKYPNLSSFYIVPRAPHTPEEVEVVLSEELARLATEPVEERELQRVINQLDADHLRGLRSNLGIANKLAAWQFIGGDWRWAERWLDELHAVTPEEIMETSATHYTTQNRTVGTIVPRRREEVPTGEQPAGIPEETG
jgi:predicted Zn-dependent peptidase